MHMTLRLRLSLIKIVLLSWQLKVSGNLNKTFSKKILRIESDTFIEV